jgi:hypothetical protein
MLNLTGNYQCTIQGVDTHVDCGGPVYTSDLRSQNLPMHVAQSNQELEIGAFGVTLRGSVGGSSVRVSYEDHDCSSCSPQPVQMQLTATAGQGQLSDVKVTLSQMGTGYLDCEKSYSGVCSRN